MRIVQERMWKIMAKPLGFGRLVEPREAPTPPIREFSIQQLEATPAELKSVAIFGLFLLFLLLAFVGFFAATTMLIVQWWL